MTEHPTELLLQIADGAVPPPEARAHLATCQRCQQTLAALAPLDLDYVWQGVAAELDAPKPSLLARLLVIPAAHPTVPQPANPFFKTRTHRVRILSVPARGSSTLPGATGTNNRPYSTSAVSRSASPPRLIRTARAPFFLGRQSLLDQGCAPL